MPSGFSSRSSAGSAASGASWYATGRRNRRSAVTPTEVWIEVVDGHGPPCCCAQLTATPVGQPREQHAARDLGEHREDVGQLLAGLGVHGRREAAADGADRARAHRRPRTYSTISVDGPKHSASSAGGSASTASVVVREHDGRPRARLLRGIARDDRDAVVRRRARRPRAAKAAAMPSVSIGTGPVAPTAAATRSAKSGPGRHEHHARASCRTARRRA